MMYNGSKHTHTHTHIQVLIYPFVHTHTIEDFKHTHRTGLTGSTLWCTSAPPHKQNLQQNTSTHTQSHTTHTHTHTAMPITHTSGFASALAREQVSERESKETRQGGGGCTIGKSLQCDARDNRRRPSGNLTLTRTDESTFGCTVTLMEDARRLALWDMIGTHLCTYAEDAKKSH